MLARLALFARTTGRAWWTALPFHLIFSAMVVGALFHYDRSVQTSDPNIITLPTPGLMATTVAAVILATLGSWVYAGQSVRADFTPRTGLRRAPALAGRATLVGVLGIVALGNPTTQSALAHPGSTTQVSLIFTVVVGLMTAAAFVLLATSARVGTPRETPDTPESFWAHTRSSLHQHYRHMRAVWTRIPHALVALAGTLFVLSITVNPALALLAYAFGDLIPATSALTYAFLVLVLPIFALCPTAAALALQPKPTPLPDPVTTP